MRRSTGYARRVLGAIALGAVGAVALGLPAEAVANEPAAAAPATSVAEYYAALERMGMVDVDTGSRETLARELGAAETLLRQGAFIEAAVALYAIVESPRFTGFEDFVEYHNAEYDLAIALAASGAYDASLDYLERALGRGPSSMYFAPAHRRAVDIALETRDYQGVLARLERAASASGDASSGAGLPAEAAGEQIYLRARIAYVRGDLAAAEDALGRVPPDSRMYSSALYLRGVIRARQGRFGEAAEALCEVAETRDDEALAFVVDDRYFTIKDLARLGLGRIAHEQGEYDDAYYHYFQIPDDAERLPEALFEASWSMYQQRVLDPARDLLDELFRTFPTAPQMPEARLLAGYIELADCKFDRALSAYEGLITELQPMVDALDRIRKDPAQRRQLFDRAMARWRAERADPAHGLRQEENAAAGEPVDQVLGLLRLDPRFVRLHQAMHGLRRAASEAPHGVRVWTGLGRQARDTRVGAVAAERTIEEEDAADANALLEDIRRLREEVARARDELRRGVREGVLPKDADAAERQRLNQLDGHIQALARQADRAAAAADAAIEGAAAADLRPLIRADIRRARHLERASRALLARLEGAADALARQALDRLHGDTRRVLDKAKLGKIDAVIGQKRSLDIQVQDLAAGRYPAELHGRLWEEGLIGDDEELWPFEGEYWADEYEGWR